MLSRVCLAYGIIAGCAHCAVLSRASQGEDSLNTSPLRLIVPQNSSAAAPNVSLLNPSSLDSGSPQQPNNVSINNVPIEYNLSSYTSSGLQCNGRLYGTNLNRLSCFDAWRNLGRLPNPVSWGPSEAGHKYQYRLPYRWSSDDGQCAIDVISSNSYSDIASFLDINRAAELVMKRCIDLPNDPAIGGLVANVGAQGRLFVIVSKYTPNVVCGEPFQKSESSSPCRPTLAKIPVSTTPWTFGRQGSTGLLWPLPWTLTAGGSICTFTLGLVGSIQEETMRWVDIWAAAIAVDAICVRQGKFGASLHLGDHRYGWVSLSHSGGPAVADD